MRTLTFPLFQKESLRLIQHLSDESTSPDDLPDDLYLELEDLQPGYLDLMVKREAVSPDSRVVTFPSK